jgi:FKBP-type peptidyl-prolyl cis-trans isomerase
MKRTLIAMAAMSALFFAACNTNYNKAKSGLVYKIFPGKGGEKLKAGEFMKYNIEYKIYPKDTVLNSTFGKVPGFTVIDTTSRAKYSFMEIVPLCSVGDSVEVTLSVDSLKSKGMLPSYNEMFHRGDQIKCRLKIIGSYKTEKDVMAAYQDEVEKEKQVEIADVQAYAAKNNLKAEKTKSGAFVVIENAGDQTMKADSGKTASIMYKGYLMSNGKVFDTNMDTSKHHTDPIKVNVGEHRVIPAWEEALPYFGKGAKGKILVPAMLGYGTQGNPEIPAYSNLVFDIEVLDVQPTPPPAPNANPFGGGMPPRQMPAKPAGK